MGQDEVYNRWLREPLERYGAVIYWFAGRWSILVTRPEYLTDMFRNEDIYAKAGNQKKIPWSVMAALLGDNIISAHGDNWKLYTSIMKPGIAKRVFDTRPLQDQSRKFVDLLLQAQSVQGVDNGLFPNQFIQRYAIAAMGESFLGTDFRCLEAPDTGIARLQTAIKTSIFKPLYLNFPTLDKYPQIFSSRKRAFALVQKFEDLLYDLVQHRPCRKWDERSPREDNLLIDMLENALQEGKINDRQFRANLKITFLTGHENVQLLLNSAFWEIGKNKKIQDKLREEILETGCVDATADIVNRLPYLNSVIFELLRLYPPISQLTNRATTAPAMLDGCIAIPANTWVGWNAYGLHTDEKIWGPTAKEFIPERWGTTVEEIQMKFRRECVRGTYIPFNAHTRKCLGQAFALLEMRIVLFELVRRVRWRVHHSYCFKLTAGGVLTVLRCPVILEEVQKEQYRGSD